MEEKRDYHRVPFKCNSQITVVDRCYECELIDISLRGVLLEIDHENTIGLGSLCHIDIAFASCDIHLQFDAKLVQTLEFERKRGMDSYFKENNWTGSTGSLGYCGLRPKGPSPQAKKFLIIL